MVTDYYPAQRTNRIFAAIMPLVGLSPALAPLLGSWLLVHFEWQAIFAVLFAITLLLMLPALRLKPANKPIVSVQQKLTFLALLRSREYSGNVLIYAACSASFFARLTGSPFILHDMGYGPTVIGLSYVPQTIAFLVGGYGCRAALQKWQGQQILPRLLAIFAVSVAATAGWPAGERDACWVDDSVLRHGGGERRYLSYRRRAGPEAIPAGDRPCRGAAKHSAAWPLLPDQPAGLHADCHAAANDHQRDAGFHRAGRHRLPHAV